MIFSFKVKSGSEWNVSVTKGGRGPGFWPAEGVAHRPLLVAHGRPGQAHPSGEAKQAFFVASAGSAGATLDGPCIAVRAGGQARGAQARFVFLAPGRVNAREDGLEAT